MGKNKNRQKAWDQSVMQLNSDKGKGQHKPKYKPDFGGKARPHTSTHNLGHKGMINNTTGL